MTTRMKRLRQNLRDDEYSSDSNSNSDDIDNGTDDENNSNQVMKIGAYVTKKNNNNEQKPRRSNRDSLPYIINEQSTDGALNELGTFQLDASTACGDYVYLEHIGKFLVMKIKYIYKYQHGGFDVIKKRLEVKKMKGWSQDEINVLQ